MVVLREGMCPGLKDDLVRDLRAADVRTGEQFSVVLLKWLNREQPLTGVTFCLRSGGPGVIRHRGPCSEMLRVIQGMFITDI